MATAEKLNAYELLGVSPDDTAETIRKAYRRLVMSYHPDQYRGDKAAANEKLVELIAAFDILEGPSAAATGGGTRRNTSTGGETAKETASPRTAGADYRSQGTRRPRTEKARTLSRHELRMARKAEWGFSSALNIFNAGAAPRQTSVYS